MNILFWNLKHNDIADYVAKCALENDADIICLAEHQGVSPTVLVGLLGDGYRCVPEISGSGNSKVILFAKASVKQIQNGQIFEPFHRCVIWSFECKGDTYNLVALHMVDKSSDSSGDARRHDANRIMDELRCREKQSGCENSILIGDFNSDPFEKPLIAKDAFHATWFKEVIKRYPIRKRYDEEFRMMYNPTIHYLSEDTKCYGSFYRGNEFSPLYWHCYDQALVSPSLVDRVKDFQYLKTIENRSLILDVRPNSEISDHLPLLLTVGGAENG